MTVIINSAWGGRVTQFVDRQITQPLPTGTTRVVDTESYKLLVLVTIDAVVTIAYTGIAVVHQQWFDNLLANTIAHEKLDIAVAQPSVRHLSRPLHTIIWEMSLNLNGRLNTDKRGRLHDLKLSIVGYHVHPRTNRCRPLSWTMSRDIRENGNRYFKIEKSQLGKYLRANPLSLWAECYGDHGSTVPDGLSALGETEGLDHDGIERYVANLIVKRSKETVTVGAECLALQIDLRIPDGHVQVTYYPKQGPALLLSPWVLMPRLICSPTAQTPTASKSKCGLYATGGFLDGYSNLHVSTRVPIEFKKPYDGNVVFEAQERKATI